MGTSRTGYLSEPPRTEAIDAIFDADVADHGYVMNLTRVWAHFPEGKTGLFDLVGATVAHGGLTFRQRGVLITAMASQMGDSYCSLAWGERLAGVTSPDAAADVVTGGTDALDAQDAALATWARTITRDPSATTEADLQPLREAGFDDRQIFAITLFVALRRAFSTVNDALGALPDAELVDAAPDALRAVVTYGRPAAR